MKKSAKVKKVVVEDTNPKHMFEDALREYGEACDEYARLIEVCGGVEVDEAEKDCDRKYMMVLKMFDYAFELIGKK